MTDRTYQLNVTVSPGTLPSAPLITPWSTEDNTIESVEIFVPPGHNGQTGIAIFKGDTQLLPWGMNTWIIANDYHRVFPFKTPLATSDVTVRAYNTGTYPHTFYLRMTVSTSPQQTPYANAADTGISGLPSAASAVDPLSPDALLGPGTADALNAGTITPADLAPVDATNLTVPIPAAI
jgi:hypothetical protein